MATTTKHQMIALPQEVPGSRFDAFEYRGVAISHDKRVTTDFRPDQRYRTVNRVKCKGTHEGVYLKGRTRKAIMAEIDSVLDNPPPATERERVLIEALELAQRMCAEALPKFNWGASALDANAIDLINRTPGTINKALALFKKP